VGSFTLNVGVFAFLIALGWLSGRMAERRHFRRLARREQALAHMLVTDLKSFPPAPDASRYATLVTGDVVIATDYMKSFLARIRKILGGELRSYQSLMSRARREAVLRMMEKARELGYDAVCNVRLNPADIGGVTRRRGAVMVAVCATGTAYCVAKGGE